jgi:hypothetical protein
MPPLIAFGFFQQLDATRCFVLPALGAQQEAGFGIELRQHERGHFIYQAVDAGLAAAGKFFQALVFVVRQSYGQCAHDLTSFKKCSGVTATSSGNFSSLNFSSLPRFVALDTVCWTGDLDIAPETLYDCSVPLNDPNQVT